LVYNINGDTRQKKINGKYEWHFLGGYKWNIEYYPSVIKHGWLGPAFPQPIEVLLWESSN
jgi:hypothetical protein